MKKILLMFLIAVQSFMMFKPLGAIAAAPDLKGFSEASLDSVVIEGIDTSLASELMTNLLSMQSGILNSGLIEHDIIEVAEFMRERGWWHAHASAAVDTTDGLVLRIHIIPGNPFYVGNIEISGITQSTKTEDIDTSSDRVLFGRAFLDSVIVDITARMAFEGYPGAVIEPALSARGDTVDIMLAVTRRERARIDSVAVRGLTRTDDRIVRRELKDIVGEPAGTEVALRAETALRRLAFLSQDGVPVIEYDSNDRGVLIVHVNEARQGTFDGVLGYQPGIDGGSGELIGRFHLDMANMFGTGREGLIRWENLGNDSEDLEIRYTEPWIFGHPWDISASFLQEERGIRDYTRTGMSITAGRRLGDLRGDIGIRYEKISADSLHSSAANGVEASLTWTVIDNRTNPSDGFRYHIAYSSLSRTSRFRTLPRTRIDHVAIDLDHYIPAFPRQVLAIGVRYRNLTMPSDRMSPADRYWLGGATTIRGYPERLLPAVKAGWTSIEYRFLAGRESRVFLFADIGYLIDRQSTGSVNEKHSRTAAGYGFGARLHGDAGTLGFDYGLGREDSITGGKVHISLSTDF